jgi:glycosyltransferase involved in cell wall biosynthesis
MQPPRPPILTARQPEQPPELPRGDGAARLTPDVFEATVAAQMVADGLISLSDITNAREKSARWATPLGETLINDGRVSALGWARGVATQLRLRLVDLRAEPPDPALIHAGERRDYLRLGLMPWRMQPDGTIVLAATRPLAPDVRQWAAQRYPDRRIAYVVTAKFDILWAVQLNFDSDIEAEAVEALHDARPDLSARETITAGQAIVVWLLLSVLLLGLAIRPWPVAVVLSTIVQVLYLVSFAFRFLLTWVGAHRRMDVTVSDAELAAMDEASLPTFTVLVPMYKEAEVLPILVESMRRLDYPRAKLDVKLVLEAGDIETIEAAKALGAESLFEIIRVPPSEPKTKPKACNYALRFARGEYVVVYDAEDIPEADQLKKVVAVFRSSPPEVACVQARLNYFNRDDNFLTRMFTLEYSHWFDYLLPGLHEMNIPIPLGGTSNHFRTATLLRVGAWDPFNVTEDADLGVRMSQEGLRVAVVNSTTFEEANGILGSWINQRSRWIKGYMQTWLVHMRHPIRLRRRLGFSGFWGFQMFIGFPPMTALINPLLWMTFLITLFVGAERMRPLFPGVVLYMAVANLMLGNLMFIYFSVLAVAKRRWYRLVPWGMAVPAYWVLHSVAAYKALWQLIVKPHHWEKTTHGTSAATRDVLAGIAERNASERPLHPGNTTGPEKPRMAAE